MRTQLQPVKLRVECDGISRPVFCGPRGLRRAVSILYGQLPSIDTWQYVHVYVSDTESNVFTYDSGTRIEQFPADWRQRKAE